MLERISFYSSALTKNEEKEISSTGRFVEFFFLRCLQNFYVEKLGKVSITLSKKFVIPKIYGLFPKESVIAVDKYFDIEKFMQSNKNERRYILLDEILDTFNFLSHKYSWDLIEIVKAYKLVKFLNFEYNFIFEPVKLSRDKKYRGGVELRLANEEAIISIVFIHPQNNEIIKRVVLETYHGGWIFNYTGMLGKRKWLNNSEFELKTRSEIWKFVASLEKDEPEKIMLGGDMRDVLRSAYSSVKQKIWNFPQLEE